jgi:hypothetical protein
MAFFPGGASFLEYSLARGGSEVEQRVTSRINDNGSQWGGIADARQRLHVVLCA